MNRTNVNYIDFCGVNKENYGGIKAAILQALMYKYTQNLELRSKLTDTELTSLSMPNSANIYDKYTLEQTVVVQQFMIDKEIRELKSSSSWTMDEHTDLLKECYN